MEAMPARSGDVSWLAGGVRRWDIFRGSALKFEWMTVTLSKDGNHGVFYARIYYVQIVETGRGGRRRVGRTGADIHIWVRRPARPQGPRYGSDKLG